MKLTSILKGSFVVLFASALVAIFSAGSIAVVEQKAEAVSPSATCGSAGQAYTLLSFPAFTRTRQAHGPDLMVKNTCPDYDAIGDGFKIKNQQFKPADQTFALSTTPGHTTDGACAAGTCADDILLTSTSNGVICTNNDQCNAVEHETCVLTAGQGECVTNADCNTSGDPAGTCVATQCSLRLCTTLEPAYGCQGQLPLQLGGINPNPHNPTSGINNFWRGERLTIVDIPATASNPAASRAVAQAQHQKESVDSPAPAKHRSSVSACQTTGAKSYSNALSATCWVRGPNTNLKYIGEADIVPSDTLICAYNASWFKN